mgnify:CR=1 FL=1|tara:strand:- start:14714 stop:15121 length:408 start_codon:yes stop_codon:yes gene_type:complete
MGNDFFEKKEKNFSKSRIDNLYKSGNRVYGQNLTLIWNYTELTTIMRNQILISVPKKKMKKAVNRNYTKRIIREAYRLNKGKIEDSLAKPIEIIIKYNKTSVPEFNKLKSELLHLLNHDSFKNNETNTKNFDLYN